MGRNNYTWKPGQSGNPKGRAKKDKTLTDILKKHGNKRDVEIEIDGEEKKMSRKEALARIVWDLALKDRNIAAIKYIYDRIDGLPTQPVDMSGKMDIRTFDVPISEEEMEHAKKQLKLFFKKGYDPKEDYTNGQGS